MVDNNENIIHVLTIENYTDAILGQLEEIAKTTEDAIKCAVIWEAQEYIRLYKKNQVMGLRIAFE